MTRAGPLWLPSGVITRNTAVPVSGGLTSWKRPRGPVIPVATTCHWVVPARRSTSRTFVSAAIAPSLVTRPVKTTTAPAAALAADALSVRR